MAGQEDELGLEESGNSQASYSTLCVCSQGTYLRSSSRMCVEIQSRMKRNSGILTAVSPRSCSAFSSSSFAARILCSSRIARGRHQFFFRGNVFPGRGDKQLQQRAGYLLPLALYHRGVQPVQVSDEGGMLVVQFCHTHGIPSPIPIQ
jgi:hypothetical protein